MNRWGSQSWLPPGFYPAFGFIRTRREPPGKAAADKTFCHPNARAGRSQTQEPQPVQKVPEPNEPRAHYRHRHQRSQHYRRRYSRQRNRRHLRRSHRRVKQLDWQPTAHPASSGVKLFFGDSLRTRWSEDPLMPPELRRSAP